MDHQHTAKVSGQLTSAKIQLVKQLLNDGQKKNSTILRKISERQLPKIRLKQLNSLKSRIKKENGHNNNSLQDVLDWCKEHENIHDDLDKLLVANY